MAFGKAIVFARHDVTVGNTREWIDLGIRDVPHPGEQIQAGRPVCTVFATGRDALGCHAALVERAERVKVRAFDQNGNAFTLEAQGLLSVCIQHEMDHLEGKVFVEHLSQLKQQRIRAKLAKQLRKSA